MEDKKLFGLCESGDSLDKVLYGSCGNKLMTCPVHYLYGYLQPSLKVLFKFIEISSAVYLTFPACIDFIH